MTWAVALVALAILKLDCITSSTSSSRFHPHAWVPRRFLVTPPAAALLTELGLTETATLPEVVIDFWLNELWRGHPILWIISHRLPCREPHETQRTEWQEQHPISAPPGSSLLWNVTKLHCFDLFSKKYTVSLDTQASSLIQWGSQNMETLSSTLRQSPPIFVPSGFLPPTACHPQGLWWKCTGHHHDMLGGTREVGLTFKGVWARVGRTASSEQNSSILQRQMTALLAAARSTPRSLELTLTEGQLGQPDNGPLVHSLHDFWTSELRRGHFVALLT
eukprot:2222068-Rhodomonas_salina.3